MLLLLGHPKCWFGSGFATNRKTDLRTFSYLNEYLKSLAPFVIHLHYEMQVPRWGIFPQDFFIEAL